MLYQRGRYRVEVGNDGSIKVKPGDWLSKYSAAIHNDFTSVHEFARRGKNGEPVPIANVNLIFAGETLLHLPTYYSSFAPAVIRVRPTARLTDEQKKKLILDTAAKDYGLKGDQIPVVAKALDLLEKTGDAVGLIEAFALIVGTKGAAVAGATAAAGTVLSIGNAFLFPIGAAIAAINAAEYGLRVVGMRAAAYGITAWAFGDLAPPLPATLRENVRFSHPKQVDDYQKAWNEARDAAIRGLEQDVTAKKVDRTAYRILLRAVGNDDRNTLVRLVMEGFAKTLQSGSPTDALWSGATKYPT